MNSLAFQRTYDFRLHIGTTSNSLIWYARSVTLPKFGKEVFSDIIGNKGVASTGAMKWDPVTVVIADVAPILFKEDSSRGTVLDFRNSTIGPDGVPRPSTKGITNPTAIGNSTASQVFASLVAKNKNSVVGRDEPGVDISKAGFIDNSGNKSLGTVKIEKIYEAKQNQTSVQQIFTESWILKNAKIASVDFGGLDYTQEEFNYITIIFEYDHAIMEQTQAQATE